MKLVAAAIAVGVLALAALALRELDVWGEDSVEGGIERPSIQLGTERAADQPPGDLERSGSACQRLAALAAGLGLRESTPAGFLRALGQGAAGIRPPPRALSDLARGGRDLIPGGGFRARYSDGSSGQVRHFAGVAVASAYGGAAATRVISVVFRRDPVRSADGRLSEHALDFATLVSSGELPLEQTGTWILENLCRPAALGGPGEG
jgi:hypothetical protein